MSRVRENRHSVEWLDGELARRAESARRIAASLVEVEQHPGHQLLAGPITGRTATSWAAASVTLAGLWRDFDAHRGTVEAAEQVRARRARPGERETAELHRLLVEPSVEVGRSVVALSERGLTGDAERVETLSLEQLAARMDTAFAEVSALVDRCGAAHAAFLGGLAPRVERLAAARRLVEELGLPPTDPDAAAVAALDTRAVELGRTAATDPLSLDAPTGVLATLDHDIAAVTARLDAVGAVCSGWDGRLTELAGALDRHLHLRAEAQVVAARAAELVAGPSPSLSPDRLPALRAALARLPGVHGWRERAATEAALRHAVDEADAELRTAHDLAAGLLERREELRGRFTAYRSRAARLRRAEDPALLALDTDIQRLLWGRPADLAAATRALAAYRRLLGEAAGPATGWSA